MIRYSFRFLFRADFQLKNVFRARVRRFEPTSKSDPVAHVLFTTYSNRLPVNSLCRVPISNACMYASYVCYIFFETILLPFLCECPYRKMSVILVIKRLNDI